MQLLCIALGGGLGALLRYGAGEALRGWLGTRWPHGTLVVNVLGCFLLGLLAARWEQADEPLARALLAVGLLGGFTTFSAFGVEALGLLREGRSLAACAYVAASVLLGLGAAASGDLCWRWLRP